MNYQKIHKEKLQAIFQSIVFENQNLVVDLRYRNGAKDRDPYLYLMSGGDTDTEADNPGEIYDSAMYQIKYTYGLVMLFRYLPNSQNDPMQSDRIDELTGLIASKLRKESTRDDLPSLYSSETLKNYPQWHDLKYIGSSEIDQVDPDIEDNKLVKTFTIDVTQNILYDRT